MISDYLPIQFWSVNDTVYNKDRPAQINIQDNQYVHEYKCNEDFKLRFAELGSSDMTLKCKDCDDLALFELGFTKTSFGAVPEVPAVTTDALIPAANTWTSVSGIHKKGYAFIPGKVYVITVNLHKNSGTFATNGKLQVRSATGVALFSQNINTPLANTDYSATLTFTAIEGCVEIYLSKYAPLAGFSSPNITFVSVSGTEAIPAVPAIPPVYSIYEMSFVPNDHDLCDKVVSFDLYKGLVKTYQTDIVKFLLAPKASILISYKGIKNFAGIPYDSNSSYFSIRIKGKFFHERNPMEEKAIETSNSRYINISSVLKKQKKFYIDDCPDYMHTKIQGILQHATSGSVLINGVEWTKDEPYELIVREVDNQDDYPLKAAIVWLTKRNYVKRNVI